MSVVLTLTNRLGGVTVTLSPVDSIHDVPITFVQATDSLSVELANFLRGPKGDDGEPGVQGDPGPAGDTGPRGDTGPAGAGAGSSSLFEIAAAQGGEQLCDLGAVPPGRVSVYINGLRQRSNAYTIADAIVTLPADLEIRVDDLLQIEF